MDSNDDLTIGARVKGWEIFTPDWDYLRQYSTLKLASLCALSVGLHPAFADPSWVFNVAKPHFDGTDSDEFCPLEDAEEGEKRAALLHAFLQRVNIAAAELCPRGTLPIADGAADAERTVVHVASFASWAAGMGWELPPEFPKPLAAPVNTHPAATSGATETGEATAHGITPTRPLPAQRFQEQEILRVIGELGHGPKALPKDIPGKAGVKAEVRKRLNLSALVFNKAWERLSTCEEIAKLK